MKEIIEPVLYIDIQAERRTRICENCGGVCYWPMFFCIRCGRDAP